MSDQNADMRWLRKNEQRTGPFTVQQLYRMAKRGEIDRHTVFWSDRRQQWLRLAYLLDDIYPTKENLNQMRVAGIKRVKVINTDWNDLADWANTCDTCRKLNGQIYSINTAPELPPQDLYVPSLLRLHHHSSARRISVPCASPRLPLIRHIQQTNSLGRSGALPDCF